MDRVTLAIHCHDDLGMAVANSLAALEAGAREVQCTINGIGERAGNACLEEIVMAIVTRADLLPFRVDVNTRELIPTSRLVSQITGFPVPPNKAVVGANAFAHESGIHQHGVLQSPVTYRPEAVGAGRTEIVIGRHSGRHGLQNRLHELGLRLSEAEVAEVLLRLKSGLRDRKTVSNDEIHQTAAAVISERTRV
jgi:2-isopropylmalate synthase